MQNWKINFVLTNIALNEYLVLPIIMDKQTVGLYVGMHARAHHARTTHEPHTHTPRTHARTHV